MKFTFFLRPQNKPLYDSTQTPMKSAAALSENHATREDCTHYVSQALKEEDNIAGKASPSQTIQSLHSIRTEK